jgi:hypothetical protein
VARKNSESVHPYGWYLLRDPAHWARRYAGHVLAVIIVAGLYASARLPGLSATERQELARRYRFVRLPLSEPPGHKSNRQVRPVHPDLEHLSAWVSSVGAAVALADLDGDGLANDICYVDVRTDEVVVVPVPGTETGRPSYAPFVLDPGPLPYDRDTMAPMGCLPGDLNEDGRMDLLVYYWARTPIAFLRTDATRPATLSPHAYRPRELVAGGERWYTNAATRADLDGDGHLDVVIGNYFADGARILDARATSRQDLPAMQDSMSRAFNGGQDRLLLCRPVPQGEVDCRDATGILGNQVAHGWTLAVGAADLDGDLLPEIYFANDFGPDCLLHNRSKEGTLAFATLTGTKGLTTPASKVLGRDSFKGMGVDFGDVDGDGILDIYVSNIAASYALEESHFLFVGTGQTELMARGRAPYVDRSEPLGLSRSGWGWDVKLADFDNDAVLEAIQAIGFIKGDVNRWPELHELAMGNDTLLHRPGAWPRFRPGDDISGDRDDAFFARNTDGIFFDIASDVGLREKEVTRGIAVGDVDGDGDLDFAVANQWGPSAYYRNDLPRPQAFLALRLLLPAGPLESAPTELVAGHAPTARPTQPAVGASATVYLPRGHEGQGSFDARVLAAQVDGGNGHSGKRSPDLHFGLGDLRSDQPLRVVLRWRDRVGRARRDTRWLTSGWHTVILGTGDAIGSDP